MEITKEEFLAHFPNVCKGGKRMFLESKLSARDYFLYHIRGEIAIAWCVWDGITQKIPNFMDYLLWRKALAKYGKGLRYIDPKLISHDEYFKLCRIAIKHDIKALEYVHNDFKKYFN